MGQKVHRWEYPLEQLYKDQDPRFVVDAIAQVICWLDPTERRRSHHFELREPGKKGDIHHELVISWDMARLTTLDPRLGADLLRYRSNKTLTVEDRPKYAAYGLALVAISCILRRRVVHVSRFRPPDLLLDTTPGALRGVEVAGRTSKGYSAFAQVVEGIGKKPGKRVQLVNCADVAEAYLSLWCRAPEVSIWEKVKP